MPTETITLRIDAELKRWLERKAETERRSVSKQAEALLAEVRQSEEAKPEPKRRQRA